VIDRRTIIPVTRVQPALQSLLAALDLAYDWLCRQRRHYPSDADVWDLRFHWPAERAPLESELREGRFRFDPLQVLTKADGEVLHLWRARDALILRDGSLTR
jgi:RNA-directed DNA polymerase